jgi:hypothetical protein
MNSLDPPPNPSADAIQAASALIALVADPAGAKKRLAGLVAVHEDIRQAHLALQDERQKLVSENARAADLREKENLLAGKESDLERAALAQAVASTAQQEREKQINAREVAADKRDLELAKREQQLADRIDNYRKALA